MLTISPFSIGASGLEACRISAQYLYASRQKARPIDFIDITVAGRG